MLASNVIDRTHLPIAVLVGVVYLDLELFERYAYRSRLEHVGKQAVRMWP